jgi:sporulation protein YlmC with PRC-barrel domain
MEDQRMAQRMHDTAFPTDASGEVAHHETANLIAADKVEGTSVYDPRGNKLGAIHTVMLNKLNGRVAYAVLSFGGFLGMGESYHPLPWNQLRYDEAQGGYVVSLTEEQLRGAPRYGTSDPVDWGDATWRGRIDTYYRPYNTSYASGSVPLPIA